MAHGSHHEAPAIVEKFSLPEKTRRNLLILLGVGLFLFLVGTFFAYQGDKDHPYHEQTVTYTTGSRHEVLSGETYGAAKGPGGLNNSPQDVRSNEPAAHHGEAHAAEGHHGPTWVTRFWANFLLNNVYFGGAALLALFFIAVSTITNAGWYVIVRRILEAMNGWLVFAGVGMLIVAILGGHYLYHWMDTAAVEADKILKGKQAFLNTPFFIGRIVFYFAVWIGFAWMIRKSSLAEDQQPGLGQYGKQTVLSAIFIFLFGITMSLAAWDLVMSIDTHWFSTMFSVHVFASLFVTALSLLTLIAIYLKKNGFLPAFNDSHLHDLGKFVFAFSIFWTYIWFCQYMLIWYANIPEEGGYFWERINPNSAYRVWFWVTAAINFIVPFIGLMTQGSKRNYEYLAVICGIVLVGHWMDFFLMIFPGTMKGAGSIGLMEIGMWLAFLAAFLLVTAWRLSKARLVPANHPYLRESLMHNYH